MDATAAFRRAVTAGDVDAAVALFVPDVVFHSPVVHRPYEGRDALRAILGAVLQVVEDFRYVAEFHGPDGHVLEFTCRVGERDLQGVDILRGTPEGLTEMTVLVRPYSAATLLRERMATLLAQSSGGERGVGAPMTTIVPTYLRVLDGFGAVADAVAPGDWDFPTPCPAWTARALVGHVIDAQRQVTALLITATRAPVTAPSELAALAGPDPATAWRDGAAAFRATLRGLDLDAAVPTPHGAAPGSTVLAMAVIEPLVHAWDLATATGQDVALDPDAVAVTLRGVEALGGALAATGMFAEPEAGAADRSPQARLLALLGRAPDGRFSNGRPA